MNNIKTIEIIRREGRVNQTNIKHYAESWKDADEILNSMATTAPVEGYDKTDFHITFKDGTTYNGRYDLKHLDVEIANLFDHVKDFILYHAGLSKPLWLSREQYKNSLSGIDKESYKDFAREYLGIDI